MKVLEAVDQLFAEKKLPIKRQEIAKNQSLYAGNFMIRPGKPVPFGVVIAPGEDLCDFQVSYKRLAYLNDYSKKGEVLELLNELNQGKTYYYTLVLGGDGEIMMKSHGKTSADVRGLYEVLIIGSNVARQVVAELEKIIPPTA